MTPCHVYMIIEDCQTVTLLECNKTITIGSMYMLEKVSGLNKFTDLLLKK